MTVLCPLRKAMLPALLRCPFCTVACYGGMLYPLTEAVLSLLSSPFVETLFTLCKKGSSRAVNSENIGERQAIPQNKLARLMRAFMLPDII